MTPMNKIETKRRHLSRPGFYLSNTPCKLRFSKGFGLVKTKISNFAIGSRRGDGQPFRVWQNVLNPRYQPNSMKLTGQFFDSDLNFGD